MMDHLTAARFTLIDPEDMAEVVENLPDEAVEKLAEKALHEANKRWAAEYISEPPR